MLSKPATAALLFLSLGLASAGDMRIVEEAAEFEALTVRISGHGNAQFQLAPCDNCPPVKLIISPATQLVVGGQTLSVTSMDGVTLLSGTVFYRPGDGEVTRIEAVR